MTTRETELLAANAALELEVVRMREVIFDMAGEEPGISWGKAEKALSTQFTPTTLNDLIEKVEKMTIERCAKAVWNSKPSQKAIDEIPAAYQLASLAAIRSLPIGQIKQEELL